ncbi:VOC family protein [Larkinella soli]|uniref:VOC family protein n=1 Tax=Larkinella soli TaxID=1770527 RepID=UPI000FFB842E|nr:VOC family protein [Larkinella soli]
MQKITPFLWFDGKVEEAARFYTSIFPHSEIKNLTRAPEGIPVPAGEVMSATFVLEGQEFMALNGGPQFQFNESVSFFIRCETQEEIDRYWEALSEGGQPGRCGWLKDRYGLSWQVVPTALDEMLKAGDPEKSKRVMQALMQMDKLDMAGLEEAYHLEAAR